MEIESIRNTLKQIDNDEKWFEWVESLGRVIKDSRDIPDPMKKELLKIVVDNIMVDYDPIEKVHRLTINFKLPVILVDGNSKLSTNVVVEPPKSGRKCKYQNEPFRSYSTVTDLARFLGWSTLQPRIRAIW